VLYRIGRPPDSLAFPPWEFTGGERFDDPLGEFRVLYAAEQRLACFVETLASLRPPLQFLADMRPFWRGRMPPSVGVVPPDWHRRRLIGRFTLELAGSPPLLDLRVAATYQGLRTALAPTLVQLGLPDLDVSSARGPSRALTQAIARWAYDHGYHGIAYRSRFDDSFDCWALFERASITPAGPSEAIRRTDPDLRAAAVLFGLRLPRPTT
jgi:hypothetical protein